ncbi:hypothetical protein ACRXCV_05085 [Halobacteriovorax sp. GFR7]|uniref:hypothetical protein n=1 Tax=unclassified Halobacteriovorax TaxID=2639665 RepID=UPI003D957A07
MKEEFERIELENKSMESSAVTIGFVLMTLPLLFAFISNGMLIGVISYFFVIAFILYFSLSILKKSDASFLSFDSSEVKIKRKKSLSSVEKEIIIPFSQVIRISTYSPLLGGTGIKIWSSEKDFCKVRTIGDSRGGRFIRFSLKNGPKLLDEEYIRESLKENEEYLGVHITKFTENLLTCLKELGYKADY